MDDYKTPRLCLHSSMFHQSFPKAKRFCHRIVTKNRHYVRAQSVASSRRARQYWAVLFATLWGNLKRLRYNAVQHSTTPYNTVKRRATAEIALAVRMANPQVVSASMSLVHGKTQQG